MLEEMRDVSLILVPLILVPKIIVPKLSSRTLRIKHGIKVNVYQYIDKELKFLNSEPPQYVDAKEKATTLLKQLSALGFPVPKDEEEIWDEKKMYKLLEGFSKVVGEMEKLTQESKKFERKNNS